MPVKMPIRWTKNMDKLNKLRTELTAEFGRLQPQVIRPAEGYLKYPYLIPAGFYKQMWDWDGFFMGNHLASIGKKKKLYIISVTVPILST
jgi:alpha,alpha-trehalase